MNNICDICNTNFSEEISLSGDDILCSTCKKIVETNGKKSNFNKTEVKKALKKASYNAENGEHHFLCHYTGIPCYIETETKSNDGPLNPFDLTFDHLEPSYGYGLKGEELAVSLHIINQIKSNISTKIFKDVIMVLGKRFESSDSSDYSPEFHEEFLHILLKEFE